MTPMIHRSYVRDTCPGYSYLREKTREVTLSPKPKFSAMSACGSLVANISRWACSALKSERYFGRPRRWLN
jgi:hypothetical protein